MKNPLSFYCSILFLLSGIYITNAQVIKIDKKEFAVLAQQDTVNLTFSYHGLTFNSEELPEKDFIPHTEKKIQKIQDEEVAKRFVALYELSKSKEYPESFIQEFVKTIADFENSPHFVWNDSSAEYTLNINADWMYYGYNYGVVKQPSKLTTTITLFKTETPQRIISTTVSSRARGMSMGERYETEGGGIPCVRCMVNSYERTAYVLGRALKRVLD